MNQSLMDIVAEHFQQCSKSILRKKEHTAAIINFEAKFLSNVLYDCHIRDMAIPENNILVFVQFIYQYSESKGKGQEVLELVFNRLPLSKRTLLFKKFMEGVEPSELTCPVLTINNDASEKDITLAVGVINNLSKMQNLNPVKIKILLTSAISTQFGSGFHPLIQDNLNLIKARSHQFLEFAHSIIIDSSDTERESSSLFRDIFAYLSQESLASDPDLCFRIGYGRILNTLLSTLPDYYDRFIQSHPSVFSLRTFIESYTAFDNISALFDSLLETISLDTLQAIFEFDKAYSIEYSKYNSIKFYNVLSSVKSSFEALIINRKCSTVAQFKLAVLELHWIYKNTTITIHSSQKILDLLSVFHSRISSQVNTNERRESLLPYFSIMNNYLENCLDRKLIVKSFQEFRLVVNYFRFVSSNPEKDISDFILLQLSLSTSTDPFLFDSMIKYTLELNIFNPTLFAHIQQLRLSGLLLCTDEVSAEMHLQTNQLYLDRLIKHRLLNSVEIELFQFVMKKVKDKLNVEKSKSPLKK